MYVTPAEAAKVYNVTPSTLRRWADQGKVKFEKTVNGQRRYEITVTDTGERKTVELGNGASLILPPGAGSIPVPHIQQYVGVTNSVRKFYSNFSDNAIQASRVNARAMWNNVNIRAALQERQLATIQYPWHVEPQDKKDKKQAAVAGEIETIIQEMPDFHKFCKALTNAIWYGRAANQIEYTWDYSTGRKRLIPHRWNNIHGDSLVFKWDSDAVGILIGLVSGWQGTKQLTTEPTEIARAHVLDDGPLIETLSDGRKVQRLTLNEREAVVLHCHDLEAGDFFEPNQAGRVRGVGIRSVCYWEWFQANEVKGWLIELLERVGTGITIVRFLRGDDQSFQRAKTIAESNSFQAVLLFPADPGQEHVENIERIEASATGIDNLKKVIVEMFEANIRRYIVGQDSTSQPVSTGLGSEIANVQEGTFLRLVKYDATGLAQTLTRELVQVIQKWTFPDTPPCKFVFAIDKPDPEKFLSSAKTFYDLGGAIDEDELRSILGLSRPDPDAKILKKPDEQGGMPGMPGAEPAPGAAPGAEPAPEAPEDDPEQKAALTADILGGLFPDEAMQFSKHRFETATVGFTGEKKDKRGFTICYRDGIRVPCPKKDQPKERRQVNPQAVEEAHSKIKDILKGGKGAEQAEQVGKLLSGMTVKGLTDLKKQLGIRASGTKSVLAQKMADKLIQEPKVKAQPNLSVEQVHAKMKDLMRQASVSKEQAAALSKDLLGLKVSDLNALKKQLGIKASGKKAILASKLADRALLQTKGVKAHDALERILGQGRLSGLDLGDHEAVQAALKQALTQGRKPDERWTDGSRPAIGEPEGTSGAVESQTGEPASESTDQGRQATGQPASPKTAGRIPSEKERVRPPAKDEQVASRKDEQVASRKDERVSKPAKDEQVASQRIPASQQEINKRLDRFEKLFKSKGQHEVASWMGELRKHINEVGGEAALKALGEEPEASNQDEVQYWGVATAEERWDNMGDFIQSYLARNGISTVIENSDPNKPLVSAYAKPDKYLAGDFKPTGGSFKNKLEESKSLPGLEKSEDINDLMGKKVTSLTPDVLEKLDATYGKGQWIVKAYGDEAAAGYGIFFPQRSAQIQKDAQDAIWTAGQNLGKYGFQLGRNPDTKKIQGIIHESGDIYEFGTPEYEQTIQGDARKWADKAAGAAGSEHGAELPDGGKEFMAQPAFQAVGISDADRAAGKTWHEKNEGRVHLVMKDGKAEVIPHSTWLKGGNLPVVFEDEDTKAMQQAAVDAINQLPEHARKGQVYAPDIMKTPDGYRVVELNAQGDSAGSGYLTDNQFTIDSYTSHLVGREPMHVQFIRKLLSKKNKRGKDEAGKAERKS